MSERVSLQEALIYVMVMVSASDSSMTDKELHSIGEIIKTLPVFSSFDQQRIVAVSQDCGERLQAENGMSNTFAVIAASVPPAYRDTAYALGVEIAIADVAVAQEELRVLQLLRDALGLDKLTVAAIERGAQARYRTT
ncbi:tellurite resistance TerB family protein [Stappia indica]|uniref:Tellurite resistance protein n=1 Tax=Stappia indica TaxID=538381 RepID=A0A285SQ10_9HYPH|nr:tellurite resistance TerB family protein [Stappia indica]MCC4243939.1 tellurite resistance TerB family protein [Stappia indica]SOC10320.1 Tellurite resistance protein [Stappia indica]